jgi:hypothetical protein
MSSAEFSEWMAYAAVEPFGSQVDDARFGLVADVAAAPWGVKRPPGGWWAWAEQAARPKTWQEAKEAFGRVAVPAGKG